MKEKLLSHVRLFTIPWTAAHQAPPSMGFSRQEYWSGVPSPSPMSLCALSPFSCYFSHTRDTHKETSAEHSEYSKLLQDQHYLDTIARKGHCQKTNKQIKSPPPNYRLICLINGEGNGTPLQYSCLENPMYGGAWWAAVHGVAKSRTRLSDFTFTFHLMH